MTIYEIAKQALAHLEYGTDDDALSALIDRFTIYINDAANVIAQHLKMEAVELVGLHNDHFNVESLSRKNVTKIVEVFNGNKLYPFIKGDFYGDFVVLHEDEIDLPTTVLIGDANLDGRITSADGAEIMRSISSVKGTKPLTGIARINADVNGDGKITDADYDLVMKYVTHLIDKFPAEDTLNGVVNVRYRYQPEYVSIVSDEPDIPAVFHPILYLYVVHCHHNSRSTSSDYDRTKWLQEFERQRKLITKAYGALDAYMIKNKPWQTGEM